MKAKTTLLLALGLAIVGALMLRSLFPRTVVGVPRIVTQYDTVRVVDFDTAWVERVRSETTTVNVVERVTVTMPETVYVVPAIRAITTVAMGKRVGDSTRIGGFEFEPLDSGYVHRSWQALVYTAGPLRTLWLDEAGKPQLTFYDPIPKACGRFCKIGHYLLGGAVGAGATAIACTLAR